MGIDVSLSSIRTNLDKIYVKYREKLGDEQLKALIDELTVVYADCIRKENDLVEQIGVLDANAAQIKEWARERDFKVVLIKQKYGI